MQQNNNYEKEYHIKKHNYLYKDKYYYHVRAKVAKRLFFRGIRKSSKVMEYGCGLGQNIYLIKNSVGYDVSRFARDFCKKKKIETVGNLNKLKNNSFDIVLCSEVLEHLENPLEALKEMYSKLKRGGKLILILPIDKWNKPDLFDLNRHLYNWNFNTITNLLDVAGFYPIHYKMIRATGFKKLLWWYWLDPNLYFFLIKLAAIISGSGHMKIVAFKK